MEWSEPINLSAQVNSEANEFYPSLSFNGNLYFTSDRADGSKGKDNIYVSKFTNSQYKKPVSLSESINSDSYEFNAFIAPDESYLLFTGYNRADGYGSGDLYISKKNENREWTKAENLGDKINSDKMDYCPFVNQNGKLYFTSKRSDIDKNQKKYYSAKEFLKDINKTENGLSRIYSVDFKP